MKKIRILIIIFIAIIFSLLILIGVIKTKGNNSNTVNITNEFVGQENMYYDNNLSAQDIEDESRQGILGEAEKVPVINESDYITVKKNVAAFLNTLNKNNPAYFSMDGTKTSTDKEIAEMELALLSENYIKKNNITVNNISKCVYDINTGVFFIPTEIKKFYEQERVNSFVVKGLVSDMENKPLMEIMVILNIDTEQTTYSVEIIKSDTNINTVVPAKLEKIEANDMNRFTYIQLTDTNIINEIISSFKQTVFGYPEVFYNNFLNSNYKNAKFANVNEFKEYINTNKDLLFSVSIKSYKKEESGKHTVYTLVDQNENKYVIEYSSIANYKMCLDNYTVATTKEKTQYDNAKDEQRVLLQIKKFNQMLNMKDYKAIYNKLNATFKNNNYQSINALSDYLKKNVYETSKIELGELTKNGDYYTAECVIWNRTDTAQKKNLKLYIKLIDVNNFEFSFNIEDRD